MKRVRWFVVLALALFVLALPSVAWASSRATQNDCAYPNTNCQPPSVMPSTETTASPSVLGTQASTGSSSLPFTGGDVAGLAGIGAGAIVLGVVLTRTRRNARARS